MHFQFNQSTDLLTPIIHHGGVNKRNPIFTSEDVFLSDDNDVQFSSMMSKKNEHLLASEDIPYENNDNNQQQDDLFSTFDLPVLSDLENVTFEDYLTKASFPCSSINNQNSSMSDDSAFYPVEDSTSPWIAGECTVESNYTEDMIVPPSPSLSSASHTSSTVEKRSTKKRDLSTIDRKLRKKDQNKTAAEKYRIKKKNERDQLNARHAELKNQNHELHFQLDNLTFRLEQFKQLFVDVVQLPISPK
ncbi:unnamed protein product [Adineta steineri]|uniref:BZIP domain-containing protein n=1 Tax=Adineta steineri TaxID=433720 RepID=A0A813XA79_9BILA|nr:unnamed protein product [Adineta steineri]CAF0870089.1 unnamed protein product [Adineta steineri]CAF1015491.1 unnamed protein product [Adineta steineri]